MNVKLGGRIELIAGDIDKDGIIGILDKTIVTKQNGKNELIDTDFNPAADINADGKINITDKTVITKNNGSTRAIIKL